MLLVNDQLLLSASDLIGFSECPHLSAIDLAVMRGNLSVEPTRIDSADLLSRKGDEHEQLYVQRLRDDPSVALAEIPRPPFGLAALQAGSEQTIAAMRSRADVLYQGVLYDAGWHGYADFLERVDRPDRPTALGDWGYEVADTKLARRAKPYHLIQLCLYSELLDASQGGEPQQVHVILGDGRRESFRIREFAAYVRRLRSRYEALLAKGLPDTYPHPVSHCGLCRWAGACDAQRVADDHLSLVAGLGGAQAARFEGSGISTVAALAAAIDAERPARMTPVTFERVRDQARLQVAERETGEQDYELLPIEPDRGFAMLPAPSPGDLYFDIEGDPFYDEGLEYLWGVTEVGGDGEPMFRAFWGRDRAEEKLAFEGFMDFVMARLEQHPDLHVYHYASYERTALQTLMGRHGTREDEVDFLLRNGVLVDLYQVVRQALRTSKPSYSIKQIEAFYLPEKRDAAVTDGGDSIIAFEQWLENGDDALLESIRAYNEEDCESTLLLHRWLLERRAEAESRAVTTIAWRPEPTGRTDDDDDTPESTRALQARLVDGIDVDDPSALAGAERSRWLLAQLLDYHRRDKKPFWWEFFGRFDKTIGELAETDSEAIGGLSLVDGPTRLPPPKRSDSYTLRFEPQEHKVGEGSHIDPFTAVADPDTGERDPFSAQSYKVAAVDDQAGTLELQRDTKRRDEPLPVALIPFDNYGTELQQSALQDVAAAVAASGLDGDGPHRAARALLARELPRTSALSVGAALQDGDADIAQTTEIVAGLQESYLFVQGPPGSGKTWSGAQLVLALLGAGKRVGITATSHKAIHNLLCEIETHAPAAPTWRGLQKFSSEKDRYESPLTDALITPEKATAPFHARTAELMAGTAWLWCQPQMRDSVDYLVLDEAGQVSLADALALSTAGRNVILLGDPLQLAQVSQGSHPDGAGASVLEHLLGEHGTIPPERGVFLDRTRRMHPDVCRFVSEVVYEDRLDAIQETARQTVSAAGPLDGTGLRHLPVDHAGNTRQSPEEAIAIAAAIAGLLDGGTYIDMDGDPHDLTADKIMVVTPYNAQVRCLAEHLPDGVEIGTVDKFQGREAQVVFFSMATSSGADVPRNVEFLLSRNRLNVAVSRARCLAVLVCSPALLDIAPRSIEQMRLVNALCRFVELAVSAKDPRASGPAVTVPS